MRLCWPLLVALAACADKDPTQPTQSTLGTFTSSGPASEGDTGDPPDPTSTGSLSTGTSVTSGDHTTSTGDESTGPESTTAGLSHAVDIAPIWAANCVAGCHTPGRVGESLTGMILEADVAYSMLVDQPAQQLPTMQRVVPGDPNVSYLWHKLNGTQQNVGGVGLLMPQGGSMLPADELERIEQWILAGAAP